MREKKMKMKKQERNARDQSEAESIHGSEMESLPDELVMNILSRVPTLDLGNLRYVCKSWRNIVDVKNPPFRTLHQSHSMSKPTENKLLLLKGSDNLHLVDLVSRREIIMKMPHVLSFWQYNIISSCNGLLCLRSKIEVSKILVMNPFTSEHVLLPIISDFPWAWGFGFDFVNKIYKVVVIVRNEFGRGEFRICDLYSHKNLYWRHIGEKGTFDLDLLNRSPACFFNGRLHWTVENGDSVTIISFDLADEEFRMVPTPDRLCNRRKYCHLFVSRGCLCIICGQSSSARITRLQIWAMKEYCIKESWLKEVRTKPLVPENFPHFSEKPIRWRPFLEGLGSIRDGEVLLKWKSYRLPFEEAILFLSNPTCDKLQYLEIKSIAVFSGSVIHTASLNWI